jgi:hypothetical protein
MHVSVSNQITRYILYLVLWRVRPNTPRFSQRMTVLRLCLDIEDILENDILATRFATRPFDSKSDNTVSRSLSQSHWSSALASAVSSSCDLVNTFGSSPMLSSRLTAAGLHCRSTRGIKAIWKSSQLYVAQVRLVDAIWNNK